MVVVTFLHDIDLEAADKLARCQATNANIATVKRLNTIESDILVVEAKDTNDISMVWHEFAKRLDSLSTFSHGILVVDIDAVLRSGEASDTSAHGGGLLFLELCALLVELNAAHRLLG